MARAMQLLLPGSRLRPEFVHAALVEARRRWLGPLDEFQRVVATRQDVIGDAVFYDPPLQGDATTRWEGALHVRGMPNALEGGHDGGLFRQFHANLANGSASNTWPCVAQRARAFDKHHAIQNAPRSFFLATDMRGLANVSFNKRMWKLSPSLRDASASMAHSKSEGPCRTAEPRVDAEPTLYFGRAVFVRSSTVGMAPARVVRSSIVVVAPRLTRRGAAGARGLKVGARAAVGTRAAPQLRKEKMIISESMVDLGPRREPRRLAAQRSLRMDILRARGA